MEIEIKHGTETVICLSGQLDTLSSPDLEKEITNILEGNAQNVVLDGGKLTYISSAGLRLLLILQKKNEPERRNICIEEYPGQHYGDIQNNRFLFFSYH